MKLDKKKSIIIISAVVLVCVIALVIILVTGGKVKTSVPKKYVDGFADSYASEKEVDDEGNINYVFEDDKYEQFLTDYHEVVKEESREHLLTYHQYTHYNLNTPEIIVGLADGEFEQYGEEALKAEAQALGQAAIKYQMNTEKPITSIPVTYRNANTSDVYFVVTVTAE